MEKTAFISYLTLEKNYSPNTVTAYKKDIESFQQFCMLEMEIDTINGIDYGIIRSWIVKLVEANVSNRTVNRKVASLKAYYKFLLKIGEIDANPLVKHKALKVSKKVEVPFSSAEMEEVLQDVSFEDNFEGIRDQLIIALFYTTGIRRIELINLEVVNVDVQSIKVLGKRNKERIIPLVESTKILMQDYLEERKQLVINPIADSFVFLTKSGNKLYENLVYRVINSYFSKVSSKLKKSPHILRHTFATHMLNEGADLNAVKELLGHASLASTQVYTHNSIAELKKVHLSAHPRSKE